MEVRDVVKNFGALKALDRVNMEIPRGKITLLIGPNGSGKTTLMNIISGVYKPDAGKIILDGEDVTNLDTHERFRKGLVRNFQIPRLFQGLITLENVAFARYGNPGEGVISGTMKRRWFKFEYETLKRAAETITFTKIRHLWDKKPSELSGGQMKLLEVARSLMPDEPKIVLMDEPTSGVNPVLAHEIFQRIRDVNRKRRVTFLVVEHRLDIAVGYVDYAYAMAFGKVIAHGEPEAVLNDPRVIESYLGG